MTLDLNAASAAANPKTFSSSGQGRSRRVAGVVLGQLPNGWRVTIGLGNLCLVSPTVCFLPIECQQSRVYTQLVLCVRMPCRGGLARLGKAGPLCKGCCCWEQAVARTGLPAACWPAYPPPVSKAPCCLQRSTTCRPWPPASRPT